MSTIPSPIPHETAARVADDSPGDYEYFWSRGGLDFRVPHCIAEILDVPLVVRLEILFIGICIGLMLAAAAVLTGLYIAAT